MSKDNSKKMMIFAMLVAIYVVCYALNGIFMMKVIAAPISSLPFAITGDLVFFIALYILSDVFSQVYGYATSRKTAKIAAIITLSIGVLGKLLTMIPAAVGNEWANDLFSGIYGGNFYITIVGIAVFYIGDWINDIIFRKFREKHKDDMSYKKFAVRSILSSFVGRTFDVLLFSIFCNLIINAPTLGLPQVFQNLHNFLGLEDWGQSLSIIVATGLGTIIAQPVIELVFSPLSHKICKKLNKEVNS